MPNHLKNVVAWTAAIAITGLAVSCSMGVAPTMPDYAAVYLNDASRTYIPIACFREWRDKPSTRREVVDISTASVARQRRYRVEEGCEKYTTGQMRSLLGSWLIDAGILSDNVEWWDKPYRTEDGMVYPKKLK